jgi:hypothetical protein
VFTKTQKPKWKYTITFGPSFLSLLLTKSKSKEGGSEEEDRSSANLKLRSDHRRPIPDLGPVLPSILGQSWEEIMEASQEDAAPVEAGLDWVRFLNSKI